ncbi:MAG TPA: VIT1/CCC1 transporter family protein [Marmoricola sp.]|nr:VIT1/CCC1 transporter family protein [Marmoricola sp.]
MSPREKDDVSRYRQHIVAEWDAAALYHGLAGLSRGRRREVLTELAGIEEKHAAFWADRIETAGGTPPRFEEFTPSRRTESLLQTARQYSIDLVLPIVEQDERDAVDGYTEEPDAPESMLLEEAGHAEALALLIGEGEAADRVPTGGLMTEPWHRTDKSGTLRAGIFGINDGLVSNTALVMGFAGADASRETVLFAGLAGLLAGAFSMGAGEYISMANQREAYERELQFEREELELHPEDEQRELELIYEAKGIDRETAAVVAARVMSDKDVALDTMAREELGLDPDDLGSPWGAAASSFLAFSLGAVLVVLPYLFLGGAVALGLAVGVAVLALVLVGGTMARLNGRPLLGGIVRQVTVGAVAAGATYLLGTLFGVNVG